MAAKIGETVEGGRGKKKAGSRVCFRGKDNHNREAAVRRQYQIPKF